MHYNKTNNKENNTKNRRYWWNYDIRKPKYKQYTNNTKCDTGRCDIEYEHEEDDCDIVKTFNCKERNMEFTSNIKVIQHVKIAHIVKY